MIAFVSSYSASGVTPQLPPLFEPGAASTICAMTIARKHAETQVVDSLKKACCRSVILTAHGGGTPRDRLSRLKLGVVRPLILKASPPLL